MKRFLRASLILFVFKVLSRALRGYPGDPLADLFAFLGYWAAIIWHWLLVVLHWLAVAVGVAVLLFLAPSLHRVGILQR